MATIVVGVDRSETSRRAAEKAAQLASQLGADLHLVMCTERGKPVNIDVGSDSFHIDNLNEADQFLRDMARKLPTRRSRKGRRSSRKGRRIRRRRRR